MTPRTILVVDDDPDARNLLDIALSTVGGFEVMICGSAREALSAIDQATPDLVLLDDRMPGADGERTLRLLRARTGSPGLPAIFLTAMAHQTNIDRLSALGALAVIPKPFDPLALGSQIRAACRDAAGRDDRAV